MSEGNEHASGETSPGSAGTVLVLEYTDGKEIVTTDVTIHKVDASLSHNYNIVEGIKSERERLRRSLEGLPLEAIDTLQENLGVHKRKKVQRIIEDARDNAERSDAAFALQIFGRGENFVGSPGVDIVELNVVDVLDATKRGHAEAVRRLHALPESLQAEVQQRLAGWQTPSRQVDGGHELG